MEEFRIQATQRRRRLLGKPRVQLSEREWETLELLHQGLSTKQIAERLYVTPATVRSHVSALLRKLHVSTRSEAVGLLGDEDGPADRRDSAAPPHRGVEVRCGTHTR